MPATALRIKNLTKELGNHIILDNITFDVKKGEIFGVIGMSGSGKTTLLSHLIGFLEPDEGEIYYRPADAISDSEKELKHLHENVYQVRQTFGFAPQTPSFYPKLTVEENLMHFGSLHHLDKKALKQNTAHLLELTQLTDHKNKLADQLSGGMQRRLSIICGMIHKPDILILDEPTADLDPVLSAETWKLITEINKLGTTIIVASHFLQELEAMCDRIAIIHNGKLIEYGTIEQIKQKFGHNTTEIRVETEASNFSKVLNIVSKKNIANVRKEDRKLVLYTKNPQKTLLELAKAIRHGRLTVKSLELNRPTLTEVFGGIAKKQMMVK